MRLKKSFAGLSFNNSYNKLPGHFYKRLNPLPVKKPALIQLNKVLAIEFGLNIEKLQSKEGVDFFSGNCVVGGSDPIAAVYAGHQFGYFTHQLGDGRAILLGEIINKKGQRFDIQLKGSGRTPFSRNGDGRSALGPVIREYIVSEAMNALGIKTTRALAAVTTGETVLRENIVPGGIFTRIASSHIRVGTFQYFAASGDQGAVKNLADYTINRHYSKCSQAVNPYHALLQSVIESQAKLISSWMMNGFVHGVMNTDNMSICGETIDYGPCAFIDIYDPNTVFSSIDQNRRYTFGNQSHVAKWNLTCFAQSILPLISPNIDKAINIAEEELEAFHKIFDQYWLEGMRRKFGLLNAQENDLKLIQNFLELMEKYQVDYTLAFRYLGFVSDRNTDNKDIKNLFSNSLDYDIWESIFKERLKFESRSVKERSRAMSLVNPLFIPRNHLVEEAIKRGVEDNDFSKMNQLIKILATPFDEKDSDHYYKFPPKVVNQNYQTFCGT
tara:strand:- start:12489 stop:13982 length:1494 start_codon:yes stop_codon:yes gene_type:complete